MKKIFTAEEASKFIVDIQKINKTIVLVGGCFDILHIGHIDFLKNAKLQGDLLLVLLEHDATIKKRKGAKRPLNTQHDRAVILSHLEMVDHVITLPAHTDDIFYDRLVNQLKPAIIATTAGDPYRKQKERQAEKIGARVVDVIQPISNKSTTALVHILEEL